MAKNKPFNARPYMELAIAEMNKSQNEPRFDGKVPPKVGAILVFPDGRVVKAHRSELRNGDHAEFTLLERKLGHEKLDGCILFTTLEPCVERNPPKVPCCRRTTNARIKTVYVGIIDPDPSVSTKGINHLKSYFVDVKMFDRDLQNKIEKENESFLKQALERKRKAQEVKSKSSLEQMVLHSSFEKLSTIALEKFIVNANLPYKIEQAEFKEYLLDLGVIIYDKSDNTFKPNGFGILLFGAVPRSVFKGAAINCTAKYGNYEFKPECFDQALVLIPDLVQEWLIKVLAQEKDTSSFKRGVKSSFPINVLREAVINAIIHRDYSIDETKNSIHIDENAIIIKSPGGPASTITIEQLNSFKAPSYSRNPIISYIFNLMGYVEETGLGMSTFKSLHEMYGLPLPEYSYAQSILTLTFPTSIEVKKKVSRHPNIEKLNLEQINGYEWLKSVRESSAREYSNHFNISYKKAQRHLTFMKSLGIITDNGVPLNSPKLKYVIIDS
jgi:ATP-dependent DNA helicase RecG